MKKGKMKKSKTYESNTKLKNWTTAGPRARKVIVKQFRARKYSC